MIKFNLDVPSTKEKKWLEDNNININDKPLMKFLKSLQQYQVSTPYVEHVIDCIFEFKKDLELELKRNNK